MYTHNVAFVSCFAKLQHTRTPKTVKGEPRTGFYYSQLFWTIFLKLFEGPPLLLGNGLHLCILSRYPRPQKKTRHSLLFALSLSLSLSLYDGAFCSVPSMALGFCLRLGPFSLKAVNDLTWLQLRFAILDNLAAWLPRFPEPGVYSGNQ